MPDTIPSDGQEKLLKNTYLLTALVNAKQSFTLGGTGLGGTFKLAWEGSGWSGTIAYNASAATVKTALEALSTIGSGNIDVTGSAGGPWTAEFIGALAGMPAPLFTKDIALLTGTGPSLTIVETQAGTGRPPRYYYLGLSHSTRATLGADALMSAIDEVIGTGYARQRVKTDGTDLVFSKVAGFWQVKTKAVYFNATAADWNECNSVFLTDRTDNSGKVMGLKTVTAFTLANGAQQKIEYTAPFADTAT